MNGLKVLLIAGAATIGLFVGICGDAVCSRSAAQMGADFPILVDGEVTGIRAILDADRAGRFLVTDGWARVLAEPQRSGLTAKAVAAEIRR